MAEGIPTKMEVTHNLMPVKSLALEKNFNMKYAGQHPNISSINIRKQH